MPSKLRATIDGIRARQAYRAAGGMVSYTSDPAWLVHMAINRRAGWVEERHYFGSCRPNHLGQFPKRAAGDYTRHLLQLAGKINTPRVIVRETELGEHRWLMSLLPNRFWRTEAL